MSKRSNKQNRIQKAPQLSQPPQAPNHKITLTQEQFSGPLPPPAALEHYECILAGSADRIIAMAEREATHRHELEKSLINSEIIETRLGQILGFLIGSIAIIAGTYAAVNGAQITGSIIGSSGVVGLVTVFIYGRQKKPD